MNTDDQLFNQLFILMDLMTTCLNCGNGPMRFHHTGYIHDVLIGTEPVTKA